jgi:hypothetical protein
MVLVQKSSQIPSFHWPMYRDLGKEESDYRLHLRGALVHMHGGLQSRMIANANHMSGDAYK